MKKRKEVEAFCLKHIAKIGSQKDVERHKNLFKSMSDKEFSDFMTDLEKGRKTIRIISPNKNDGKPIDKEKLLNIIRDLGYDPYQPIVEKIPGTNKFSLSKVKTLTLYVPVKRLSQHAVKGISIPKHNRSRDAITGQVTNDSRAAKITQKELGIFNAKGYESALKELMMSRSGDEAAEQALQAFIEKYGNVTLEDIEQYAEGSQSTKSVQNYFKAIHLKLAL